MREYITSDLPHQASSLTQAVSPYLYRTKNHAPEGQGSLISEWSEWSRDSALVLDTKSQSRIVEVVNQETGEIQTLTSKNNGKKKVQKNGSESRAERFSLQSVSRDVLGRDWRVSKCNRCMYHLDIEGGKKLPKGYAAIMKGDQGGAFFGGLVQCGSVWTCPVCGAKIAERRADEMRQAMREAENRGLHVSLLTLTVKHGVGDQISDLLPQLGKAQVSFWGRRFVKDTFSSFGLVGRVRSLEVTYGSSGWHPHVHILIFTERKIPKAAKKSLAVQWQKSCLSAGLSKPTLENGLDIRNGEAAGEYICKFADDSKLKTTKSGDAVTWDAADEMTKSQSKQGRQGNITPFDMLRLIQCPDTNEAQRKFYRARFEDYAKAFKGRRQLVWSRGLRDEFGLGADLSDEQLVKEMREETSVVVLIDREEMKQLNNRELRATALTLAENGGIDAVSRLLYPLVDTKGMSFDDYRDFVARRGHCPELGVNSAICPVCGHVHSFIGQSAQCPECATRVTISEEK